jgi:hypothetical protein
MNKNIITVGAVPKQPKGVYSGEAASIAAEEFAEKVAVAVNADRNEAVAWLTKMKAPASVIKFLSR